MKRRVFLFPAAVFLGTACLLSGCGKKSATDNAGEVHVYNYDVICPSDYMIQKMIENDLLAELNFDNIPNISEIDPEFMERSKAFDPENKYSVPYTWGTVGILYNTSMVAPEDVPTYGSIPGSFRKMQRIKKMLKNGLISCAVRILPCNCPYL